MAQEFEVKVCFRDENGVYRLAGTSLPDPTIGGALNFARRFERTKELVFISNPNHPAIKSTPEENKFDRVVVRSRL